MHETGPRPTLGELQRSTPWVCCGASAASIMRHWLVLSRSYAGGQTYRATGYGTAPAAAHAAAGVRRSSTPAGPVVTSASSRFPLPVLSLGLNTRRMLRANGRHILPCLPSPAERPPSGDGWLREIKHDGMRIMARRDGAGVRLITRQGNDFTSRFPLIVAAIAALPRRSFLLDGEAICTNNDGLAVFDLIRRQRHGDNAVMVAFDLIELDGDDLRRIPIERRKAQLLRLVRDRHPGIVFNAHYIVDGGIVFMNACKLGCEGIVSKRLGSAYRSGRSANWIKVKNPKAPAVKREAEEDWGKKHRAAPAVFIRSMR